MLQVVTVRRGKVLDKYLKKIAQIKTGAKVGILNGATYPDGLSVATVAYINENGEMGNPRRPFMHRTMEQNGEKWVRGIKNTVNGNFSEANVIKAYDFAGQVAKADMINTIKEWSPDDPRPNAPATIAAKARKARSGKGTTGIDPNRVLIDTTTMIQSIDYEVVK